jgi:predicted enzyme related to lactoylglutathione lyase
MSDIPTVGSIVINTTDPDRLAGFWGSLLGVEIANRSGPWFIWLKPQHDGGVSIAFQKVDAPTDGRRRLHLDTFVEDPETAIERAIELGATRVEDHTAGGFSWTVMGDPDGNEFCIAPAH